MIQIGAFEAKNRLAELLQRVEMGEEIVITRRGEPVAQLIPVSAAMRRKEAEAAVARIRERRKGVILGDLSIKELINEGRR